MTPNPPPPPGQPFGAPPPSPSGKTSGLAITAFVLSLLGLCTLVTAPIGFILGIVALVKLGKTPGMGGKGLAIAALVIPVFSVITAGILAAIAIPNFMKFQARAKQSECKTYLKTIFVAQKSLYGEANRYAEDVAELGFRPTRPLRYSYFVGVEGPFAGPGEDVAGAGVLSDSQSVEPSELPDLGDLRIGVSGECPECEFTAICAGQLDTDGTYDVWMVSSEPRTSTDGESIAAGEVFQLSDDVTQ